MEEVVEEEGPFVAVLRQGLAHKTVNMRSPAKGFKAQQQRTITVGAGLPTIQLIEDEQSQHWGGHIW